MWKDTLYHKTFEEFGEIRKMKNYMWTVWLLTCSRALNIEKDKVQVPQRNEVLSVYCTTLGLITKNEEYNRKEKIPNGRYLKNLILQTVVNNMK